MINDVSPRRRGVGERVALTSVALVMASAVAAPAVPAASLKATAVATATRNISCSSPFPPVAASYAYGAAEPLEVHPPRGPSLASQPFVTSDPYYAHLDTDGDGDDDTIGSTSSPRHSYTIHRRDGVVLVRTPGGGASHSTSLGDLDGDGRTEFVVYSWKGDISSPTHSGHFVVSAPIGPRTIDPFTDGVRMPPETRPSRLVGDQDGDGTMDVAIASRDATGREADRSIASGKALVGPHPGDPLTELPPSIVPLTGALVAVITFGAGPPALVDLAAKGSPVEVTLTVHEHGRAVRLAEARIPLLSDYVAVDGFRSPLDGHRYLSAAYDYRGPGSSFAWDLDDPCRAPTYVAGPSGIAGAIDASGLGLWFAYSNGIVQTVGGVAHMGDASIHPRHAPMVGIAPTTSGRGYWLVGRDGGIFCLGDAGFHGSTGDMQLNKPVVSIASDPQGRGYWFAASDGGVFAFGAPFHGSTGNLRLQQPVVGIAATKSGNGYWLVAGDGGIFSFGSDAAFSGSTGNLKLNQPIVGMAADPDGTGYWMAASDGGVFAFNAKFHGSGVGALTAGDRVVGIVAQPEGGYLLLTARGAVLPYGADARLSRPAADVEHP